jgi:hypothetical protein
MFQSLMLSAFVMGQAPVMPSATEASPTMRIQTSDPLMSQPVVSPYSTMPSGLFQESASQDRPRTTTIAGTPYPLIAAGDEPASPFSGSVTLNQDSFFGFYPILNGAYQLNDRFYLTFYGLFWTNPGFTPSGTGGTGLWTEIAAGIGFNILDDLLYVNPAVGFLNGRLLSGADRSVAFEGIVTQISFSHAAKYTEGQLFWAYYTATSAPTVNNFLHWWITGGVRPFADSDNWSQIISVGAHFEQLYQTKNKLGDTSNLYTWIGPYVQFTLPNNVFMRVNVGWDTQDTVSGNFYKATIGYVF